MPDPVLPPPIRRALLAQEVCGLRVLDAVTFPEGGGTGFRVFLRHGSDGRAFDVPGNAEAGLREVREVSGGVMLAGVAPTGTIDLPTRAGRFRPAASVAETDLFAGLDAAVAVRMEEPAEIVAEWLAWHAATHGLRGAVILNRAPDNRAPDNRAPDDAGFAAALQAARRDPCTLVVLDAGTPLGKPDTGPEAHPFLAPDAPGKDRMEPPAPDPWRAPLGEPLVWELVKWRYLARAAAVMNLDISDILDISAADVFAATRAAPDGIVALDGLRAYPWRVRPDAAAHFGDHICRPFDRADAMRRWCVAPEAAGLGNTWRMLRVSNARPIESRRFWRCMGLRVPGRAAAELAPKTSLVEEPALLALAEALGHKPVRQPASERRAVPAAAEGRTAIVTTMKNEGPFILEWLAFHRAIGVDDFLVYTNDCTDGTDTLLDLLAARGLVVHRDNPFRGTGLPPQHAALQAAEAEAVIRAAGWIICMDVDEFIDIRLGQGRLSDLYAAAGDANMISLTWRLFGNADVAAYEDRPILEQFTLCAEELCRKPHQAWGFKTLFRNIGIYKKLGVHRPKGLKPDLWDQIHWLNGSGRAMPKTMLRNGWRSTLATYGYDWVSLNHYALRSAESFLVKRDRGRVNHVDRDQGLNYWFRMNHNAVENRTIQRRLPAMRAELARLMADPAIAAAHEACVAAHRAKIAELRARPDQAAFYADLTGARLRTLSRRLRHFGSAVFHAGPDAIPDEIALAPSLPDDFFFTLRPDEAAE
ncbi:MAG: glycosyltransferase family 2 protein [Rhodobacteraceae bacterium]|nr:glycosyltransferase family 2 protein [Paracoccaceae bacterium]